MGAQVLAPCSSFFPSALVKWAITSCVNPRDYHPSCTMIPFSSCIVTGVFYLTSPKRGGNCATYLSAIDFPSNTEDCAINIAIKKYTHTSQPLFVNGTFVFLVAKAFLPPGEEGTLDALVCTSFQPSEEGGFQQSYSANPAHTAIVTGKVVEGDSKGRSFTLSATEYVQGLRRTFSVRYVTFTQRGSRLLTLHRNNFLPAL